MKPIIFTFASLPDHPGAIRMRESCKAWGWPVDLHSGAWEGDIPHWRLFASQMDRYRAEGYTHLLRLDSFDVVAIGPPDELETALAHYGSPAVLVSAERGCWPANYRQAEYPPCAHGWSYAHSPLCIDLTQETPAAFLAMPDRGYGTDQMHLADLILDGCPGVAHDREQRVTMSAAHVNPWTDAFRIEGDRVRNTMTGSRGLFLHGNGQTVIDWAPRRAATDDRPSLKVL